MASRVLSILVASLIVLPIAATADPILIGESRLLASGFASFNLDDLNSFTAIRIYSAGLSQSASLRHGPYTPADNGKTVVLDATNQPEFPRFAQLLSNGVDDSISVGDFTGGFGQPESYSFNFPPGGDFAGSGFDITRFDVKITFTARQVGTGYDGLFGQTISVYGERQSAPVPEPASLSLLALGLVGLCARRCRRRKV